MRPPAHAAQKRHPTIPKRRPPTHQPTRSCSPNDHFMTPCDWLALCLYFSIVFFYLSRTAMHFSWSLLHFSWACITAFPEPPWHCSRTSITFLPIRSAHVPFQGHLFLIEKHYPGEGPTTLFGAHHSMYIAAKFIIVSVIKRINLKTDYGKQLYAWAADSVGLQARHVWSPNFES